MSTPKHGLTGAVLKRDWIHRIHLYSLRFFFSDSVDHGTTSRCDHIVPIPKRSCVNFSWLYCTIRDRLQTPGQAVTVTTISVRRCVNTGLFVNTMLLTKTLNWLPTRTPQIRNPYTKSYWEEGLWFWVSVRVRSQFVFCSVMELADSVAICKPVLYTASNRQGCHSRIDTRPQATMPRVWLAEWDTVPCYWPEAPIYSRAACLRSSFPFQNRSSKTSPDKRTEMRCRARAVTACRPAVCSVTAAAAAPKLPGGTTTPRSMATGSPTLRQHRHAIDCWPPLGSISARGARSAGSARSDGQLNTSQMLMWYAQPRRRQPEDRIHHHSIYPAPTTADRPTQARSLRWI